MELGKNSHLTKHEQFEIASIMHAVVLEELFRATKWQAEHAVFHGGTALALARNSARFSEDLDFMVDENEADQLEKAVGKTCARVRLSMGVAYPGCQIELKGPKGDEVTQWSFKWSHPARRGKVIVKAEFLLTNGELLKSYKSASIVPIQKSAVGIRTLLPVPELVSAWADKVKAIATRPAFKWRDAYDLAFIADCMRREDEIDADARREAITATAALYGKTPEDVAEGLALVVDSGVLTAIDDFELDMSRWFADETFENYKAGGFFVTSLEKASREIERTRDLLAERGMRP